MARAVYGKWLIGKFDAWFRDAIDYLDNPMPAQPFSRKNSAYRQDKYFRDKLSTLSSEQKLAVRHLVRTIGAGILFSSLVVLDQCPYGEYCLALKLESGEGQAPMIQIAPDKPNDMHDELNDWIVSFSQFANEIVELIEVKHGWQFQSKNQY